MRALKVNPPFMQDITRRLVHEAVVAVEARAAGEWEDAFQDRDRM